MTRRLARGSAVALLAICLLLSAGGVVIVADDSEPPSVRGFACPYSRALVNNKFYLSWCTSDVYLKVLMQANTTGWVAIGFGGSAEVTMEGVDIALGYVDAKTGGVVVDDCIGMSNSSRPDSDATHGGDNDLLNIDGWEADGWTSIQFDRLIQPTDTVNDRPVDLARMLNVLVAFGPTDDFASGTSSMAVVTLSPYSSLTTYALAPRGEYRSLNGSGNNVDHPTWGQSGDTYAWKANNSYADGISAPTGQRRPSPRIISNKLMGRDDVVETVEVSTLLGFVGQFLAGDITLFVETIDPWPIPVPMCDPVYDPNCENVNGSNMEFHRSAFVPGTGTSTSNPRLQINDQTAFIDASHIYGYTDKRAKALRSMLNGTMLLDPQGQLPNISIPMAHGYVCPCRMRAAGDPRANLHAVLVALYTVFVREHNRWCAVLQDANPDWHDETLYQEARRRVVALWQKIALYDYLPAVLGRSVLGWAAYNPKAVPRVLQEFSVAAFRYGHSELQNTMYRVNKMDHVDHIMLMESLFDGYHALGLDHSVENVLRGAVRQRPGQADLRFASGPRSYLFGNPGGSLWNATDLAARNIQRGRDHGLPSYTATRKAYNMTVPTKWQDVTTNVEDIALLTQLYPNISDVDLYVGGLAEERVGTALVGPLFTAILDDNIRRLRDGDRFWFENGQFTPDELAEIHGTRLADIIRRNTALTTTDLPDNVMYLDKRYTSPPQLKDFPTKDGFPDPARAKFPNPVRYDHELIVLDGAFKLLWSADDTYVNFMLQVKTQGWVGIGFEPAQRGLMIGADVVMARIFNNSLEINDFKTFSNVGKPALDTDKGGKNDVEDAAGVLLQGYTIVRFRRKRVTDDGTNTSAPVLLDQILWRDRDVLTIFAFQESTNKYQYHGHNAYTVPILFQSAQGEAETRVTYATTLLIVSFVLCGLGILLTILLAIFQHIHRKKPAIKLASPAINNVMFVGAILAYASIPHFTMDSTQFCDPETTLMVNVTTFVGDPGRPPIQPCSMGVSVCLRRLWLLSLGFTLVFSSMFSKTYRVHHILVKSSAALKRIVIKNSDLYKIIGMLTFIDCVLLLCWTFADPFELVRKYTGLQTQTSLLLTRYVIDQCVTGTDAFWGIMLGYKAVLLGLAAYTATTTRNVFIPDMRDFSSVAMAIYSIMMVCFIVLPALYLLRDDVSVRAILAMGSIFFCTTTTLLIMFVPKIHDMYWGSGGERSDLKQVMPSSKSSVTTVVKVRAKANSVSSLPPDSGD